MAVAPGSTLGPYEILSPLGAGGMGEVYRAKDGRLNRTVAIKVLSDESAADPDRRERFEREAKAISALDHPNICALYDVGEHQGTYFLVMPCLEGETLADRLEKGPLPPDQAIKHAIEIATALDAAHRHGIIHRDLKPGNIMLTKSGVKLLDFGLAKLKKEPGPLGHTTIAKGTGIGTLLGTMPYMSPEQIEGRDVDARSDIFALGAVVYEMITGQRAFKGDSPASVIGAILKDQPPPIQSLQPLTPPALDHVVSMCLEKDPDDRWQSAADIAREIKWLAGRQDEARIATDRGGFRMPWWAMIGATVLSVTALGTAGWVAYDPSPESGELFRFQLEAPPNAVFARTLSSVPIPIVAVSPNGRRVAFIAAESGRRAAIWVRSLDDVRAKPVVGTDNAVDVFWSPDNQSLGFFADGRLKRVDVASGSVQDLCEASFNSRGGAWSPDGVILFGDASSGIRRVSASGGETRLITTLAPGVNSHRWPWFLPDGRHFLFFSRGGQQNRGVYVTSIDGGEPKRLLDGTLSALYANGHLLTVNNGTMFAYPFDPSRLEITGEPIAISGRIGGTAGASTNQSAIWVSQTGVLGYAAGFRDVGDLIWFDRSGKGLGEPVQTGNIMHFRLSPDERQLATTLVDPVTNTADIWMTDLQRGSTTRLTLDPANDLAALWSRDGQRLVYRSDRSGDNNLYERSTVDASQDQLSGGSSNISNPTDWTPDGRFILFHTPLAGSSQDVLMVNLDDKTVVPLLQTRFQEYDARLSPNGRWMAYVSEESGRPDIYVQPFPPSGSKFAVSTRGGSSPRWRNDGKELFYLAADGTLMSVPVDTAAAFRAEIPKALFKTRTPNLTSPFRVDLEVSGDGQRFLINTAPSSGEATPITIVVNWLAALSPKETGR